jgi:uncharacterized protein YjcR
VTRNEENAFNGKDRIMEDKKYASVKLSEDVEAKVDDGSLVLSGDPFALSAAIKSLKEKLDLAHKIILDAVHAEREIRNFETQFKKTAIKIGLLKE